MLLCPTTTHQLQPIDIVLDLDGTLIYAFPKSNPDVSALNPNLGIQVPFGYAHGTIEFIQCIQSIPNIRLSFYSSGDKWRNESVVYKIMNEVKKPSFLNYWWRSYRSYPSYLSYRSYRSYRILSKEDLTSLGEKDLTRIRPGINIDRTILIDDIGIVPTNQKSNVLKLYPGLGSDGGCMNNKDSNRLKNNLVRALGMILKIIELDQYSPKLNGSLNIRQLLWQLQWDSNECYRDDETNADDIYGLGLSEMRKFNSKFTLK